MPDGDTPPQPNIRRRVHPRWSVVPRATLVFMAKQGPPGRSRSDGTAAGSDPSDVEVHRPKHSSVGIPGIAHAMQYAWSEMGAARSVKALLKVNHVDGFDCPSCAWPDPHPDERKAAEFCENGAKAVAWEATRRQADAAFFDAHPIAELRSWDHHDLEAAGRLTEPLHLAPGDDRYRPISWDAALRLIADRLLTLGDPNRAAFYTSGRASNEAAFVYQLLARRLGTNNLPDCSNMCHESSGAALTQSIGIGKGTVTRDDIARYADLIIIAGQNPGTNHPRMLTALEEAKRRGARIVAINPMPEAGFGRFHNPQTVRGLAGPGTQLADRMVPVRVNGDLALFSGLNKILAERETARPGTVFDRDFLERYCDGLDGAVQHWRSLEWSEIERLSGITRGEIDVLADDIVGSGSVIVCWAMGLTQHRNAVATIREIANFLLLRGNIGRPGAGPSPIRGHSNVQGDRTMGIWEKMPDAFLDALAAEFGFDPPRQHGLDTVDTIRAMRDGRIDVFMGLGGNFAAATPDTAVTEAALASVGLTVHVATKPNRSHVCHGRESLLLPCLGRTERDLQASGEQFVTVEDSMSMVHASRGRLAPGSDRLRSEVGIITGIAALAFPDDEEIGWSAMGSDYRLIRKHIEHVVPGFAAFEDRVIQPGGFVAASRTSRLAELPDRERQGPPDRQPADRRRGPARTPAAADRAFPRSVQHHGLRPG